jgi:hypothetical protein
MTTTRAASSRAAAAIAEANDVASAPFTALSLSARSSVIVRTPFGVVSTRRCG